MSSYLQIVIDAIKSQPAECYRKVIIQPVCPWGKFTTALNVSVRIAIESGYEHIMFQVIACVLVCILTTFTN